MRLDRAITLGIVRPFSSLKARLTGRDSAPEAAVPVLMYHSISDDPEPGRGDYYKVCTSPKRFREQMRWLREEGFETTDLISLLPSAQNRGVTEANTDDADSKAPGGPDGTPRRVVITFDDGFEDFRTAAWPVLREFGFTATMFLPTDFIGHERREFLGKSCLTWNEVRELAASGITFGSHTRSHPKLAEIDRASLDSELVRSRESIEQELGVGIDTFAHPYAFPSANAAYVARFREAARSAAYRACVTTTVGRFRPGGDPLTLPRLPVNYADDQDFFRAKLHGDYDWLAKPQDLARKSRRLMNHQPQTGTTG